MPACASNFLPYGVMNAKSEQNSFSPAELAGGSAAVAAVALIALFGCGVVQIPSFAALSSFSTPAIQPLAVTGSSAKQPSGLSDSGGVTREQQAYRLASGADDQNAAGPSGASRSGSPLAYAADAESSPASAKALPALPTVLTQAQTVEAAAPPPPETQRNPLSRSDAIWIQDRLHELGYLSGNADGVWDVASRNALHDFKSVNGLSPDDGWDKETEQLLSSGDGIRADHTFIGRWASDIGQCRQGRDHGAPIVITSRAAETGSAECDFRSVTRQVASRWRVTAMCSAGKNSWNANLQLKLTAPSLTWDRILEPAKETVHNGKHTDIEYARFAEDLVISTEQGTGRYVRCLEP